MNDLNNVLHALSESENQEPASSTEAEPDRPIFRIGEHIAAFWINDFFVREWFVGSIEDTRVL